MTDNNLDKKITELKELKAMKTELDEEIAKLEDILKAEMESRKTDVLRVGIHRLTYKSITSRRFDSKAFKAVDEVLYNKYTKETVTKRFCVV